MRAGETLGIVGMSAKWTITSGRDGTTANDQQRADGYESVLDINIDLMIPHHVVTAD
jgi:hypothetical protein